MTEPAGRSHGRRQHKRKAWLLGSLLAVALPAFAPIGYANTIVNEGVTHPVVQTAHQRREAHGATGEHITRVAMGLTASQSQVVRILAGAVGVSCVPYARNASGIALAGNAWEWWANATGTYARGRVPEPGSVLIFRANGRMPLGHVAVVARAVNSREIEVDHANWAGGGVALSVPVVDVSDNNDWTAVRVGFGRGGSFGSTYPTYGFIYDRPDTGGMPTAINAPLAEPALNLQGRNLRPAARRTITAVVHGGSQMATPGTPRDYDEVAEAPSHPKIAHGGDLVVDRAKTRRSRYINMPGGRIAIAGP